jgi:hypothetical protein
MHRPLLAHVPEKWTPVFRKEHAPLKKKWSATRSIRAGCALECGRATDWGPGNGIGRFVADHLLWAAQ